MRPLLLLLLAAAPAAAQDVSTAAVAASTATVAASTAPALPEAQASLVRALQKDLDLLLRYGPEGRPDKAEALSEAMSKFDETLKEALGKALLERVAAQEKAEREAALTASASRALLELRLKLRAAYAAKGGVYPKDLAELGELPALQLPDHDRPGGVRIVDSKKYDGAPEKAVEDGGGWLYFSNPASSNYGMLLLDCGHKDAAGTEFGKY